jgi:hypothetical protein
MLSMHIILALACYFVFSAGVGAMSQPTDAQQRSFLWLAFSLPSKTRCKR